MTKNEEMVLRAQLAEKIEAIEIEGLVLEGNTVEGIAFSFDDRTVVLKTIVKKEDFDLTDALTEYEERETARLEREKKKAEKLERVKAKTSKK